MIQQYQKAFADTVGADQAFAFWKGRVALYATVRALGIGQGDEVILPAFTCVVVPNAVAFTGATPIFADIERGTYNLNPATVEDSITSRTRAIIIQHTFGIPADLDALVDIARRRGLMLIEDCAHSLGSTYRNQKVGTFGDASFFSSQWSKPYTTGLGGVAVTSNPEIAKQLELLQATFAKPPLGSTIRLRAQYAIYQRFFNPRVYWFAVGALHRMSDWNLFVGSSGQDELNSEMPADTTWQMSSFQAQTGLQQLQQLRRNLGHRNQLLDFYVERLDASGWPRAFSPKNAVCSYLRYPIQLSNKWDLLDRAKAARIEVGSWFESVLHPIHSSFDRFNYEAGRCPVGEQTANEVINLPLHPRVSATEAERIIKFLVQFGKPVNGHC